MSAKQSLLYRKREKDKNNGQKRCHRHRWVLHLRVAPPTDERGVKVKGSDELAVRLIFCNVLYVAIPASTSLTALVIAHIRMLD